MQAHRKIPSALLLLVASLSLTKQLLFLFRVLFAVDCLKEMIEDLIQSQDEEKCGGELSQNHNNYFLSS